MRIQSRSLNVGRGLAVASALTLVGWGAVALPAAADGGDPAGNNGTVKIAPHDGGDGENTAHVACDFDIKWYGFDEGADIVSTVVFTMLAPTSDVLVSSIEPSEVFVGEDPAGGAGNDFDGEASYTLGFGGGAPDAEQGYHVKVTVHTPGSQGADTKHKVLWVSPCVEGPPQG
jgi:hypothetical protein